VLLGEVAEGGLWLRGDHVVDTAHEGDGHGPGGRLFLELALEQLRLKDDTRMSIEKTRASPLISMLDA
jgi:hypothetical protein